MATDYAIQYFIDKINVMKIIVHLASIIPHRLTDMNYIKKESPGLKTLLAVGGWTMGTAGETTFYCCQYFHKHDIVYFCISDARFGFGFIFRSFILEGTSHKIVNVSSAVLSINIF